MNTQVLHAGQDREVENKDFQLTVADQRATQELVSKARGGIVWSFGRHEWTVLQ